MREVGRRPPSWLDAELILACDVVAQNQWHAIRVHDVRAIELSELLRAVKWHRSEERGPTFRNLNSVQHKTFDIATRHPDYRGKVTRGGKLDSDVLGRFIGRPEEMHAQAAAIRAGIRTGDLVELPASTSLEEQEAAKEGRILVLRHLRRERSSSLRAEKIKKVLVRCGRLECEVCNFDFEKVYGDRGIGFAEIHHLTPLHVTGPVETTTSDLAVLCANCHRMIHRGSQWLGPAELRDLILARLG